MFQNSQWFSFHFFNPLIQIYPRNICFYMNLQIYVQYWSVEEVNVLIIVWYDIVI
jgi:hypothetical protein